MHSTRYFGTEELAIHDLFLLCKLKKQKTNKTKRKNFKLKLNDVNHDLSWLFSNRNWNKTTRKISCRCPRQTHTHTHTLFYARTHLLTLTLTHSFESLADTHTHTRTHVHAQRQIRHQVVRTSFVWDRVRRQRATNSKPIRRGIKRWCLIKKGDWRKKFQHFNFDWKIQNYKRELILLFQ